MKLDCVVGIDVGKTGGISIVYRGQYKVHKMPEDLKVVDELLRYYKELSDSMLVIIETVRMLPQDLNENKAFGRVNRITKLLAMFEKLKAVMIIADIPFISVNASTWQKYLGLRPEGWRAMTDHERKKLYQQFAQANFPEKVSLNVADAVCLMVYGIRNVKYNPDFISILPDKLKKVLF